MIVLPERVLTDWWRADGHRLALANLADVIEELAGTAGGGHRRVRADAPGAGGARGAAAAGCRGRGAAYGRGGPPLRRARPPPDGGCTSLDLLMAAFALESGAFGNAQAIPSRHSCEGEDVSPPLRWTSVPEVTRSLIVDDPDAPGGVFTHWIAWGLDPAAEGWARGSRRRARGKTTSARAAIAVPAPLRATAATAMSSASLPLTWSPS